MGVSPIGSLPFKYLYFPLNPWIDGRKSIHVNYMGVEPKIGLFFPPNQPFVHGVFHEVNHPFSGTIILGNRHIYIYTQNPTDLFFQGLSFILWVKSSMRSFGF